MDKTEFEKRVLAKFEKSVYLVPSDSQAFQEIIKRLAKPFKSLKIDKVVSTDMNGLLYGPIVANKLRKPFAPILKGGKVKNRKLVVEGKKFIDYSGEKKFFEAIKGSIQKNERILYIDDWFETGNSGKAAADLVKKCGGKIVGISILFNQLSAKDEKHFQKHNFHSIIRREPSNNLAEKS